MPKSVRPAKSSRPPKERRSSPPHRDTIPVKAEWLEFADDSGAAHAVHALQTLQGARETEQVSLALQIKLKKAIGAGHLMVTGGGISGTGVVLKLVVDALFDSHRVDVKAAGKTTLAEVAAALGPLRARRFQITVHAAPPRRKDAGPMASWELCAGRALAVVKHFVSHGIHSDALAIGVQWDGALRDASAKMEIAIVRVVPPLPPVDFR